MAGWVRSTRVWAVTVVIGVLATLFTNGLLQVPGQLFDSSAAKDKLRPGPDFSVSAEVVRLDDEGRSAVTREEFRPNAAQARMLGRPSSVATADFDRLLRAYHAVNLDMVTIRITLTSHRNQQIDIEDIRPLITARTAPLSGTLLDVPSQGGASTMNMLYDMDRPFPVARDVRLDAEGCAHGEEQQGIGPPFFAQRTITLHDSEQQVLIVRAVTQRHYVAFRLEADYLLGSRKKKTVIDNDGTPFEVSGMQARGEPAYRSVYRLQDDFSLRRVTPEAKPPGGLC